MHAEQQALPSELLRPHAARSPLHPEGLAETGPGGGANPETVVRKKGFNQKSNY